MKWKKNAGKKKVLRPREDIRLPAAVKRSSGVTSNFMWDNSAYLLGIDAKGKPERSLQCFHAAAELHREFLTAMCGTEQDVLFEQIEDGWFTGHAPNGMKVYARGEDLHNTVRRVRIEDLQEEGLRGEIL